MGVLTEMLAKASNFDPSKDTRFITYMNRVIDNAIWGLACPISDHDRKFIRKFNNARKELGLSNSNHLNQCDLDAVAQIIGVNTNTVKKSLEAIDRGTYIHPMDAPMSDDSESGIETLTADPYMNPEEEYLEWQKYMVLDDIINSLSPKKRDIIKKNLWTYTRNRIHEQQSHKSRRQNEPNNSLQFEKYS